MHKFPEIDSIVIQRNFKSCVLKYTVWFFLIIWCIFLISIEDVTGYEAKSSQIIGQQDKKTGDTIVKSLSSSESSSVTENDTIPEEVSFFKDQFIGITMVNAIWN